MAGVINVMEEPETGGNWQVEVVLAFLPSRHVAQAINSSPFREREREREREEGDFLLGIMGILGRRDQTE
jgi:hypothetical protein